MKRLTILFCIAICLGSGFKVYSQLTFTVNGNPGFTLTCATPTLVLQATSNYTPAQPTYTFFSPSSQIYSTNTVSVSIPGTWTITANAGTATATQTLAIFINTIAPTITLTSSGSSITCSTHTVLLSAATTASNPIFSWIEPGVGVGGTTGTLMAAAPGLYGVIVKDPMNGCTNTATIQVFDGRSYPVFDAVSLYTVACPGGTVNLTAAVLTPTSGISYKWLSPMGAVTSGSNTPVLNTNAPGVYTLAVTNTITGCITRTLVNVWACVGIEEKELQGKVKLYPNPAENRLFIEINPPGNSPIYISITNSLGQTLMTTEYSNTSSEIDLSLLKSGIYYLILQSDSGSLIRQTFCVSKP